MVKDFPALATIASISYGCDWLVRRLSAMCNATTRKVLLQAGPAPGANSSPALRRSTAKSFSATSNSPTNPDAGAVNSAKAARMETVEARNTLINAVVVRYFCSFALFYLLTLCLCRVAPGSCP